MVLLADVRKILEREILDPIPELLRTGYLPDEHQVLDDLANRRSAAKEKNSRDMATIRKMLPQMLRQSTSVPGNQDVSLTIDPPEHLRVGRTECRRHVIADDQDFHFRLASQQLIADGVGCILVQQKASAAQGVAVFAWSEARRVLSSRSRRATGEGSRSHSSLAFSVYFRHATR